MNKIKLNLDQLKVDTFETDKTKTLQGTVKANEERCSTDIGIYDTNYTCFESCGGNASCEVSCWNTCDDSRIPRYCQIGLE